MTIGDLTKTALDVIAPDTTSRIVLAGFIAVAFIERLICLVTKASWTNGDAWSNFTIMFVGIFIDVGAGSVYVMVYTWCFDHLRLFEVDKSLIGLTYAFVVVELISFLQHWMYHRVGILWAMHSVHHSSSEMNISVANRSLWGLSAAVPFQMITLPLLGLSLPVAGIFSTFHIIWGYLEHTQFIPKLGFLDSFINTASNHRVHHGTQPKYLDRNFSQGIILFDRLFGTYQREEEKPAYGLVHPVESRNPLVIQVAGFRALFRKMSKATVGDKLRYLYKPPEWSHEDVREADEALAGNTPERIDRQKLAAR